MKYFRTANPLSLSLLSAFILLIMGGQPVFASEGGGHVEPFASPLLWLMTILVIAVVGKVGAQLLHQSTVLGELLVGVIAGNVLVHYSDVAVLLANFDLLDKPAQLAAYNLDMTKFEQHKMLVGFINNLGQLGVLFLMFMVGLENHVKEMIKVGFAALKVAIVGVVLPMLLGFAIAYVAIPNVGFVVAMFLGACLCATSVGITARVIKDLGLSNLAESKIILGAAVIDDVLGLLVLAMATSIATTQTLDMTAFYLLIKVAIFFALTLTLAPKLFHLIMPTLSGFLNSRLILSLIVCFVWSVISAQIGLAMIVGAFLAGLLLDDEYFTDHEELHHVVGPLESVLAPIFFVLMGFQVKLSVFFDPQNLVLLTLITVVALIGKVAAGYVVDKKHNRLAIGLGMIPRGEVGLIFVAVGKNLGVFDDKLFGAVVGMIIISTLVTPIFLSRSLSNARAECAN